MSKKGMFHQSSGYISFKITDILSKVDKYQIDQVISHFFSVNRIFVYGAGRSGLVARAFAIRLVHLGFQTFVIGETIGAPVKKDDLVFIITGSGETIPAVMTAEIAQKIGAKVVVVTSRADSRITQFADISVILAAECDETDRRKLAPLGTLFEASAWLLLDALVAELMDKKGETEQSMQARHATLE
ncbi:MAG: SIS domain-containing protein [Candidatus Thermoplasmatota archaeon]|nr:SIS domain-containing protein [Candidatus Thermoplasmatota archaeon]MBU1941794.1 SIS domain-containing protein [Candidatus Thermoplasmatota archaeon]